MTEPTTTTDREHVLVGTAGHVDHGKTRLVARLTGIDTDRLPEEKARGISIDLGFAHWEAGRFRFGVVDVPGHERFVRTMVAGATGVDVALLVVAADDGVMPQTREHLDVMQLLGLATGVVAITKSDLVDDETLQLVRLEVAELVAGTFLESAEVIPVSAVTGEGVDKLGAALVRAAEGRSRRAEQPWFRLPIDRAFTLAGHGTIVTGSAWHGTTEPGDTLTLLPPGRDVRVRSVETHGERVGHDDGVDGRRRTAVNLAGIGLDEVARGMELVTPGTLEPTSRLVVRVRSTRSAPTIRNRDELRLHLGTSDVAVRVILPEGPLVAGGTGFAELRTREPVVAAFGQPFILRRPSPAMTIAGGDVLDPRIPDRHRLRGLAEYAASLAAATTFERLSLLLVRVDAVPSPLALSARIGAAPDEIEGLVESLRERGELVEPAGGRPVHRARFEAVIGSVVRTLERELTRRRPRRTLPRETVRSLCEGIAAGPLVEAALEEAVRRGELIAVGGNLGPAGLAVQLSKRERTALETVLAALRSAGDTPPPLRELVELVDVESSRVAELLDTRVDDGELVRISEQLWFPTEVLDRYRVACVDMLGDRGRATLSELRELWGVTRKWAVPVAEHLDATGVTVRDGDIRRLATPPPGQD